MRPRPGARAKRSTSPGRGLCPPDFVGEDDARRFYIQTERLEDDRVVLEVLAFSATGERLAVIQMPENDYAIWTAKLVDVRGDGALVALLPQQDQAVEPFLRINEDTHDDSAHEIAPGTFYESI